MTTATLEVPPNMADLSEIPLSEMAALGPDVLSRAIGRVLPRGAEVPVAAGKFQSSI